jgi:hypothetical protein
VQFFASSINPHPRREKDSHSQYQHSIRPTALPFRIMFTKFHADNSQHVYDPITDNTCRVRTAAADLLTYSASFTAQLAFKVPKIPRTSAVQNSSGPAKSRGSRTFTICSATSQPHPSNSRFQRFLGN